jgi:hypothetical protein
MKTITKMLAGAAGLAAIATAAPAAAQYAQYSPYPNYGYSQPYGYAYGNPYGYANTYGYNPQLTQIATQQCSAAVQNRLARRVNIGTVIASLLGANASPRIVGITQVTPRRNSVTIRGLASTGRMAAYSPYGVGAYGALGAAYAPDLSFRCTVDNRGYVRDVDIFRR